MPFLSAIVSSNPTLWKWIAGTFLALSGYLAGTLLNPLVAHPNDPYGHSKVEVIEARQETILKILERIEDKVDAIQESSR